MLVPSGVWLMIIFALVIALMLRYTRLGRHIIAVGSNEQTARLCGVRVERVKLIVYVLGDVIAAVFIGGASISGGYGSIFGSLVGAVMMTMLANGCTKMDWPNSRQEIATGVIIIIAVALDRLRHPPEVKG